MARTRTLAVGAVTAAAGVLFAGGAQAGATTPKCAEARRFLAPDRRVRPRRRPQAAATRATRPRVVRRRRTVPAGRLRGADTRGRRQNADPRASDHRRRDPLF